MEYWVWGTSSLTPDAPRTPCGRWRCRSSASGESKEFLGDREEWEWTVEIWEFPGKIMNKYFIYVIINMYMDVYIYIYIYIYICVYICIYIYIHMYGCVSKCGTHPSCGHLTGTMIINQRISWYSMFRQTHIEIVLYTQHSQPLRIDRKNDR